MDEAIMKVILVHGDDRERSEERLKKFVSVAKARGWNIAEIGSSSLNIIEEVSSNDLFQKEKLFVLKDLRVLTPKIKKWLDSNLESVSGNLVIYSNKTLNKTTKAVLPKINKEEEYKLPVVIFKLLENFYPGNANSSIKLLSQSLEKGAPEFVVALLARHLKDLYLVKEGEGVLSLPSWRMGKLRSQASRFEEGGIERIIEKLAEADFKSKTSDEDLTDMLNMLIIEYL